MAGRVYRWLGPDERARVALRLGDGVSVGVVAREFGCSVRTVFRIQGELGAVVRVVGERRLSFCERERISRGIAAGESARVIAGALGRSASTVCREICGGGGRERYRALAGERRAWLSARRPKPGKLSGCPRLLAEVEKGLGWCWSPQQISARLKRDFPHDQEMRISHETIYQSLYVQSRGELRRQLTAGLRTGRTRRRAQGRVEGRGRIAGMVAISERPPEVADRAVPGHWEGDLLVGKQGRSSIATLVERQTRYLMLARLGNDRSSAHVIEALKQRVEQLPAALKLSLTWDQGKELSSHQLFSVQSGVDVYFCDPHSPWQRGSNENTNGLLRQYLPKGSDLAVHTQAQLDQIAGQLNARPRETLDWMTPAEKMLELLS